MALAKELAALAGFAGEVAWSVQTQLADAGAAVKTAQQLRDRGDEQQAEATLAAAFDSFAMPPSVERRAFEEGIASFRRKVAENQEASSSASRAAKRAAHDLRAAQAARQKMERELDKANAQLAAAEANAREQALRADDLQRDADRAVGSECLPRCLSAPAALAGGSPPPGSLMLKSPIRYPHGAAAAKPSDAAVERGGEEGGREGEGEKGKEGDKREEGKERRSGRERSKPREKAATAEESGSESGRCAESSQPRSGAKRRRSCAGVSSRGLGHPSAISAGVSGVGGCRRSFLTTGADLPRPTCRRALEPQHFPAVTTRRRRRPAGYKVIVQDMPRNMTRGQIYNWIASCGCPAPIANDQLKTSPLGRAQICLTFALSEDAAVAKRVLNGVDLESGARPTQTKYWKAGDA